MPINIQDYLLGRIPVGRKIDIPAYLMAKAASGGIREITGTLPLTVRSRASQILKNYIIYGTASGAGVETENLFDYYATWESPYVTSVTSEPETNSFVVSGHYYAKCLVELSENTKYIMSYDVELVTEESRAQVLVYSEDMSTIISSYPKNSFNTGSNSKVYILFYCNTSPIISDTVRYINTMLTKGTTAPSTYIPYGYKLPLKVTANGTTTDYPVYIGDIQLMAEEYVDYEKQKIYKLVDGVLTPTDPPVPLPDITIPKGEVTVDTEEEVKPQATIKGKIEQI